MSGIALVAVAGGMFVLSALAVPLVRIMGRDGGYVLAGGYAAGAVALSLQAPGMFAGTPVEAAVEWLPAVGARLILRMDALAFLFSMLVLLIGALVMAYTARYLRPDSRSARLYSLLTLFAASMLGLVLAGDALLLFVFWELTSISSFFLIGGDGAGTTAPKAATRAFLVTGLGGLALLAGLVLLAVTAGSWDLLEMVAASDAVRSSGAWPAIAILLLGGAFTKSAQIPFHFWLPGAMVAPTPVSTYLHAATMVKAGIYLLARTAPLFAGDTTWTYTITFVGLATALYGAAMTLAQYDLKALLAYSTVSQLGFIVALVGVGTYRSMAAAALYLVAHSAYKATLFMVVGIIDAEAGSRDIRLLSGLGRAMPFVASATAMAALSMAGVPPFLGFIAKEEAFGAFIAAPGPAWFGATAGVLAVAASIMTFGYSARIFDGAFGGKLRQSFYAPRRSFVMPAMVVATAGLVFGLAVPAFDVLVNVVAAGATQPGEDVHLTLWHGFSSPLLMSAITIGAGLLLYRGRRTMDRFLHRIDPPVRGESVFDRAYDGVLGIGRAAATPFTALRPARHLLWVLGSAVAAGLGAWAAFGRHPTTPAPGSMAADWVIAGLIGLGVLGVARSTVRIGAVAILGVVGFLVSALWVVLGAPDLALTQILVETLTVVLVVLVFRKLPRNFTPVAAARRLGAAAVAVVVGALAALAAHELTGHRELSSAGAYYLQAGPEQAGGDNVVNTILVDFRALDTFGEITVLAVAAIGVYSLVRLGTRSRP